MIYIRIREWIVTTEPQSCRGTDVFIERSVFLVTQPKTS